MKKFAKELHVFQLMIYEYLKSNAGHDDGENFMNTLMEIEEGFESVPENIYNTYQNLKPIERIEVIHFFTKYLMRKNKD